MPVWYSGEVSVAVFHPGMRWLLISLLVSLGALLLAAAGVARHIWLQHRGAGARAAGVASIVPTLRPDRADEPDIEPEV